MNAPITGAGHPDAKQPPPPSQTESEPLGEGFVTGNIISDPQLRYTQTGRAVAKVRVAYSQRIQDTKTNGWRDGPPEYYDVTIWGPQADNVVSGLIKGDRIVAAGTWTRKNWTDRDGEERTNIELTARDIGPSMLFREVTVHRPVKTATAKD